MPRGRYRSRSLARKHIRLPGGRTVIHYVKRRPRQARCSACGGKLGGIPRVRDSKRRKLSRSKRRPKRPYAGIYCPSCLKKLIKAAVFGNQG
ncbi:MAG: 50S ribosomal protein L34e [Promethearchaeota archaeon]